MAWFTHDSPCIPIIPMFSGWLAGKAPNPRRVIATGALMRSANARTSFMAPLWRMPWPARMTGFLDASINSTALVNCDRGTSSLGR